MTGGTRRSLLRATAFPAIVRALSGSASDRPNVLWILGDDLGCELGCYSDRVVKTPAIDALAGEGVRFTRFHTTAPVCSASRSAFNIGLYQTTTGTHNHRSHRKDGYRLPAPARTIMDRFREAGYFTANVGEIEAGVRGTGKTDFNFNLPGAAFDGTHWNQRRAGQPFFAQINFQAPHKGPAFAAARRQKNLVDPARVQMPPYYPDHPVVRDEYANYLDAVQLLDAQVGAALRALERDGLSRNTVVMMFGDNGQCLLRGKQWLYRAGTNVPLIVRWPGVSRAGAVRQELATSLDMNATSLYAAGIEIPAGYHGRPLWGPQAKRREWIATARDRCDMTVDRIRCVRDQRYAYIRNFMPERPYTQHNQYIETSYPTLGVLKELHAIGKLDAVQSQFMAPRKPEVELYDTQADPFEIRNLAGSRAHQKQERRLAGSLESWMKATSDQGGRPESPEEVA